MSDPTHLATVPSLNLLSFNCWGLKYISTHRRARLLEIGHAIATTTPIPDIVALQECWVLADYHAVRDRTRHILPHGKFYHSGVFGSGLVILSRWPILETSMDQYPLNGRPTAFFRGDWFVGKGIASARIEVPHAECVPQGSPPESQLSQKSASAAESGSTTITLLNTHLHAPYEPPHRDTYACHRTAQAWRLAHALRDARERGHLALGIGDFNMVPDSLAYQLVTAHGGVQDAWRSVKSDARVEEERGKHAARRREGRGTGRRMSEGEARVRTVGFSTEWEGLTCDSAANTWRWDEARRQRLEKGTSRDASAAIADRELDLDAHDPWAKRLDYVFVGQPATRQEKSQKQEQEYAWQTTAAETGMMQRHPSLHCSLSDHYSIACTLSLLPSSTSPPTSIKSPPSSPPTSSSSASASSPLLQPPNKSPPLPQETYTHILTLTSSYIARQQLQRRNRLLHFGASIVTTIACWIAVWFVPLGLGSRAGKGGNAIAFVLLLVASLGFGAGVLDGLIGGIFGGAEMSALREFAGEVRRAVGLQGVREGEDGDEDGD